MQIALVILFIPLQELLLPDGGNAQEVVDVIQQLSSPTARVVAVAVTTLLAPLTEQFSALAWPPDGALVSYELLGKPVDCPTSHVESMTRARHQWQASW